jgi:hypothetical protein
MEHIAGFIADPAAGVTFYEVIVRLYKTIASDLADGQPQDHFAGSDSISPTLFSF